jgi:uncharacterized membrane protein YjjP (DUF1212 family)
MHVEHSTALIVVALISSIILVLNRGDRLWPVIAVVATGIVALMHFGVITLSLGKFRVDVILPGLIALAAALCWSRSSDKSTTTAATALLAVALLQLLSALSVLQ